MDLSTLDGTNGFTINGINVEDASGRAVDGIGDINGDGIDDVMLGSEITDVDENRNKGAGYVVFGRSDAFSSRLELSSLDGTNGFAISGENAFDLFGTSLSNAGDVNGDGLNDLVVSATAADTDDRVNVGAIYVVFGRSSGFEASLELASLDGTNGFRINGENTYDNTGESVSGAGDVNGDGFDDLIIGNRRLAGGNTSGKSYVVFGQGDGFASTLELSSLNGDNGFVVNGLNTGDYLGGAVSGAGDVNGDGVDDLIIGALGVDPENKTSAGSSYIVFGIQAPVAPVVANPVVDQQAKIEEEFRFPIPANTFTDRNENQGDTQTLSVALEGGGPLPAWLTFNTQANTLTGTPPATDVGTILTIEITVTDGSGFTAQDVFDLSIIPPNTAPVLSAIGAQTARENEELTFTADATDDGLPNDTLTFSLDAASVGKGMVIDSLTGVFSWTPQASQGRTHEVTVTVSDGEFSDSETFAITLNLVTSIQEEVQPTVQVHPNPIDDRLQLSVRNSYTGKVEVRVTSMDGQLLYRLVLDKTLDLLEQEMDLGSLKPGVYLMEVRTAYGNQMASSRIVKR